jgi:GT2 family glycosyltransferase
VSVVLCVRNGGPLLDEQLVALSRQRMDERWELVVVDNGSTDDSMARVGRVADRFPHLTMVRADERAGLSYARNEGWRAAAGEVIAFCDADDVVRPDWLANLCAQVAPGQLVGGALDYATLNDDTVRLWRSEEAAAESLPRWFRHLPCVMGANFAITRADLEKLDGFDERMASSDEVDLSYRAAEQGMRITFAPDAVVAYRLRTSLAATLRQSVLYGRYNVRLYRKYRATMPEQPMRWTVDYYSELLRDSPDVFRGRAMRGRWLCLAAYRWGRISGSIRERIWYP